MKKNKQDEAIQYVVYTAIVLLVSGVMAVERGLLNCDSLQAAAGILSDCFFVPGAFLAGAGALGWMGSRGTYDSLGYTFSRFSLHNLFPNEQSKKKPETLFDYKQKKDEKGRKWSRPLLFTGLGSVMMAVLMLVVYLLA